MAIAWRSATRRGAAKRWPSRTASRRASSASSRAGASVAASVRRTRPRSARGDAAADREHGEPGDQQRRARERGDDQRRRERPPAPREHARNAGAGAGGADSPQRSSASACSSRRDRFADERERLAQVERRPQLGDGRLACAHHVARRRREQPGRQHRLARGRARAAQQLEETARAEEIEIVGVQVLGIAEALAARAPPGEARVEARDPVLVVADRVLARVGAAQHAIVRDDERDEAERGREQPARIEPLRAEGDAGEHDAQREHREPRLRDARRAAPRRGRIGAPRREAALVLGAHAASGSGAAPSDMAAESPELARRAHPTRRSAWPLRSLRSTGTGDRARPRAGLATRGRNDYP